jgi:hydrogenase maturation protease
VKSIDKHANRLLIIACGNPLRCDDGVAWQVADEIRRTLQPPTKVICVHQLTPELAEEASRVDTVIFIDATRNREPGQVLCQAISPDSTAVRFSHHLVPAQVLALCQQLYGAKPRGFLVSISGECFDHGNALSPAAINAIPQSVAEVDEVIRSVGIELCG